MLSVRTGCPVTSYNQELLRALWDQMQAQTRWCVMIIITILMFTEVWYGTGMCLVPIKWKIRYWRLCKSNISYNSHPSLQFIEISNHPYSFWQMTSLTPFFLYLYSTSLSSLKHFFFRTCDTAWFTSLIWHFISNCPLSWVLSSSVLHLSRSHCIQFNNV